MLYFDEAGNTGDNLLDANQPVFVLSSHDYTEDEVKEILKPLLHLSNAGELHFKKIKKSSAQRKALIEVLNNKMINSDRIYSYAVHKKYLIAVKMVDSLSEVFYHNHGIDIYQGGANISTANIIHLFGTQVWNSFLYDRVCEAFVKWVRGKTQVEEDSFFSALTALIETVGDENEYAMLAPLLFSRMYLNTIVNAFEKYYLDVSISCFIAHCHHWSRLKSEKLNITIDPSKPIDYWRGMIEFLSKDVGEKMVGYGSRKHRLGLQIQDISTGDSKSSLSLQLADLIASSVNTMLLANERGVKTEFESKLFETQLGQMPLNFIWPSTKVTPEELDMVDPSGTNALDEYVNAIRKSPSAIDVIKSTKK